GYQVILIGKASGITATHTLDVVVDPVFATVEVNIPAPSAPLAGIKYDVFILAGQSNMVGRGDWETTGAFPQAGSSYTMDYDKTTLRETTNTFIHNNDNSDGSAVTTMFREYGRLSHRPSILLPVALGGSAIAAWQDGTVLFNGAVTKMQELILYASNNNILLGTVNYVWLQGENDQYGYGLSGDVLAYMAAFNAMWYELKIASPQIDTAIILRVGLDPAWQYDTPTLEQLGYNIPRAQNQLVRIHDDVIFGHQALTEYIGTDMQPNVHFNQKGYEALGRETAAILTDYFVNGIEQHYITDDPSTAEIWGAAPTTFIEFKDSAVFKVSSDIVLASSYDYNEAGSMAGSTGDTILNTSIVLDDLTTWSMIIKRGEYAVGGDGYSYIAKSSTVASDWVFLDDNLKISTDETSRVTLLVTSAPGGEKNNNDILLTHEAGSGVLTMYSGAAGAQVQSEVWASSPSMIIDILLNSVQPNLPIDGLAFSFGELMRPNAHPLLMASSIIEVTEADSFAMTFDNDTIPDVGENYAGYATINGGFTYLASGAANLGVSGAYLAYIPNITSDQMIIGFRLEQATHENSPKGRYLQHINGGDTAAWLYMEKPGDGLNAIFRVQTALGIRTSIGFEHLIPNLGDTIDIVTILERNSIRIYFNGTLEHTGAISTPAYQYKTGKGLYAGGAARVAFGVQRMRIDKDITLDVATFLD
ncbi:MAG: hypothetical protein KAH32_03865, partial [Chlamydiia bacterium]|nr:hypothetical protein [Chlamydiia bacterium]